MDCITAKLEDQRQIQVGCDPRGPWPWTIAAGSVLSPGLAAQGYTQWGWKTPRARASTASPAVPMGKSLLLVPDPKLSCFSTVWSLAPALQKIPLGRDNLGHSSSPCTATAPTSTSSGGPAELAPICPYLEQAQLPPAHILAGLSPHFSRSSRWPLLNVTGLLLAHPPSPDGF